MQNFFFLSLTLLSSFYSSAQLTFTEKIIDAKAPVSLWMKTIGDINNDSKTDILVGGRESGGLVAYLAPNWSKLIICDTLHVSTDGEVVDLNNDSLNDLIAIVDRALIWLSAPNWKLNLIDSLTVHDVEVIDLDGDGLKDIVARDQSEWGHKGDTLFIFNQQPKGIFSKSKVQIPNGEGLKIADLNADGRPDIIINSNWYENTGRIQKWIPHQYTTSWTWRNTFIDVADMNADGRPDILLSPSEIEKTYYHVSWFEAPKMPWRYWKEHIIADPVEAVIHFIGASDFNSDGIIDVMTAAMAQGKDPDEVVVYQRIRKGKFKKIVISTEGSHSMRLFDFDGDGDIDAFGANHATNTVKMWINQIIKE